MNNWTYAPNEFGIKAGDVVFRHVNCKSDSGFFLVEKVTEDLFRDNGVRTTITCKKIAHLDGKECRGQVNRRYDVGGLKVVNQKFIDETYAKAIEEAEVMRTTITAILEDINALNI